MFTWFLLALRAVFLPEEDDELPPDPFLLP
jgi:hypothetical protein